MRKNSYTGSDIPDNPKVWKNKKCTWVSVPKNANMMMRSLCSQSGMTANTVKSDTVINTSEVIGIIRDPRSRLLSGLVECQKRNSKRFSKMKIPELLKLLLHDITLFDEHLEPQIFYLQNFKFTHILKFENLKEELLNTEHFSQHKNLVNRLVNSSLLKNSRSTKLSDIQQVLSDNKNLVDQCVSRYYGQDQKIWQSPDLYIDQLIPAPEVIQ